MGSSNRTGSSSSRTFGEREEHRTDVNLSQTAGNISNTANSCVINVGQQRIRASVDAGAEVSILRESIEQTFKLRRNKAYVCSTAVTKREEVENCRSHYSLLQPRKAEFIT